MTSSTPILIKNGRVIDPSQGIDRIADVVIEDGKILGVEEGVRRKTPRSWTPPGWSSAPGSSTCTAT